jgi:hypothetical protein
MLYMGIGGVSKKVLQQWESYYHTAIFLKQPAVSLMATVSMVTSATEQS